MSERVFTVEGMTCDHCVQAVTREVSAIPGVTAASVDLAAKQLTVSGDVAESAISDAVAEAGYTLVS
ncbi:MAG: copper chaperone [Actinobacteria bacterium]|nr:copper chaperone [Actinomycetota bacterium]